MLFGKAPFYNVKDADEPFQAFVDWHGLDPLIDIDHSRAISGKYIF
jgi:hypothetical protein